MSAARMVHRIAAVSLAAVLFAGTGRALTTWFVDQNGIPPGNGSIFYPYTSLQYAISIPTTKNGNTLLVLPGTYVENINYLGKALRIASYYGLGTVTLDGGGAASFLSTVTFDSGEGRSSVLDGFTVRNGLGTIDGTFTYTEGGGVLMRNSSPTIRNCIVDDNEADKGGGLFGLNSSALIDNCTVSNNNQAYFASAVWGGGCRFDGGSPDFSNVVIEDNFAYGGGGGAWFDGSTPSFQDSTFDDNDTALSGGGACLWNGSSGTFTDCTFTLNYSSDDDGGGLNILSSSAVMTDCTFDSNTVDNDHTGGAIYVGSGGSLDFRGGEIRNNYSARGGGIGATGTLLYVEDSRITGNTADVTTSFMGEGGGVWVGGGTATLLRCVIDNNQTLPGIWVMGVGGGVHGPAQLENCTIVYNTSANSGGICAASMHNCIHAFNTPLTTGGCVSPSVTYSDVAGGHAGVGNIAANPLFVNVATQDYHLTASSPCINTGDPSSPLDPDGSRADMGAYPFDTSFPPVVYCTAGISASGCNAAISSSGTPSATASSGFDLIVSGVEGSKRGLFFTGTNGRQANPWGNGTSHQCVVPPVARGVLLQAVGTTGLCDASYAYDLHARWTSKPSQNPGSGVAAQSQFWHRDPFNTSSQKTSLSNAIEFYVGP